MIRVIIVLLGSFLLKLRYRIKIVGLDKIEDKKSLLFLPNHPALIDPLILFSLTYLKYKITPLSDSAQVNKPLVNFFTKHFDPIKIDEVILTRDKDQAYRSLDRVVNALNIGKNMIVYPSGRIFRSNREDLRANSSVEYILKNVSNVNIVKVRTNGLWGSSFSRANDNNPQIFKHFWKFFAAIILNLIFFLPKRDITIEFEPDSNFPKNGNRRYINQYLENFYNKKIDENRVVPLFPWEGRSPKIIIENSIDNVQKDISSISERDFSLIKNKIFELSGIENITPEMKLGNDLLLDSLSVVEITSWIEKEYGVTVDNPEGLITVADLMLATKGFSEVSKTGKIKIDQRWFESLSKGNIVIDDSENLTDAFIKQLSKRGRNIIVADQISGVKTYRDLATAIFALKPHISSFNGNRIGIMLPASVGFTSILYSTLFSGKTPVMFNWTTGDKIFSECVEKSKVKTIVTTKKMIQKLKSQGYDYSRVNVNFVYIEDIGKKIGLFSKIKAKFNATFRYKSLRRENIGKVAAILFTSGSENLPKIVPLSHKNIISNYRSYLKFVDFIYEDSLLAVLPPFHSLGLSCGVFMPVSNGIKTAYYVNPNEGGIIADHLKRYKITHYFTTPTFIKNLLLSGRKNIFKDVKLVITGAEKCPDYIYDQLEEQNSRILEGYGITECSPVVSLNRPSNPHRGSIGEILPSFDFLLIDPDTGDLREDEGILLVRGESVFEGYEGNEESPFVYYNNKLWYNTGDIVSYDGEIFRFLGRKKRFVKIGGEMISLVMVENILLSKFNDNSELPVLALSSTGDDDVKIVLYTTLDLEREEVNKVIIESGLTPLHTVKKVVKVNEIPILGSGKIDYKNLS
ncbi:MAG: hypothetical protein CR982_03565 [Candidatus Cloacimonadota bacterium]|nr:MAG: hypothetical protein CR982_03565 [Candidatus Cloacimonadota bacterium]PIE78310.1 MAG: hypothetical protein CSA15_08440 [Candidatus Delongbacteria bacterium]